MGGRDRGYARVARRRVQVADVRIGRERTGQRAELLDVEFFGARSTSEACWSPIIAAIGPAKLTTARPISAPNSSWHSRIDSEKRGSARCP